MALLKKPLGGSCLCGKVRIEISAPPLMTMACHCRGCQKLTSSAFSLSACIPVAGFKATGIEPVIGALHADTKHLYCPCCKNWLYSLPKGVKTYVNVHPTLLDDIEWFSPFAEVHTAEKVSWACTPAIHSFERFPCSDRFEKLFEEFRSR